MAQVLVLEFDVPEAMSFYRKVSQGLGIDPSTGEGDWPPPLLSHVGAASGDKMIVVEIWESRELQEEFMTSRLIPAMKEFDLPPPTRAEWFELAGEKRH